MQQTLHYGFEGLASGGHVLGRLPKGERQMTAIARLYDYSSLVARPACVQLLEFLKLRTLVYRFVGSVRCFSDDRMHDFEYPWWMMRKSRSLLRSRVTFASFPAEQARSAAG